MATALVALATITLSSSTTNVTFSSIPTTGYRDLRLVIEGTATPTEGQFVLYINNDSGNNYFYCSMYGFSTGSSGSTSAQNVALLCNFQTGLAAGDRAMIVYDLLDAFATDKHKTVLYRANHPREIDAVAGRWANTAAITSLKVTMGGVSLASGSTLSLYGVLA